MKIEYIQKCKCGAVTIRFDNSASNSMFWETFEKLDLDTGDATWLHQSYCCDHCVNHWGIGLCGCGSGQKVGKCECGSQKAHDILGVKYDSFGVILKKLWIMDIVSKYTALLGQQKLKESFVKDLELVLSRKNPNIEKGKLNFIRYSEMKNWSVRELFGEDLEQADRALINKVYHMLFDIGSDFESVIRMLYSFRNGPKSGIKVADPEDNYEWTNKDGNEKYSTKNLPKAHFRWDWRRYTLSKESVDKITEFVDTILES